MAHQRWENKIKSKYSKDYSFQEARALGYVTNSLRSYEDINDVSNEHLSLIKIDTFRDMLKKQRKYNRPSYLKAVIEWAKTPAGQAYYRRQLKR